MPVSRQPERGARALLVSPDRGIAAELAGLLRTLLPGTALVRHDAYPGRGELAAALSAPELQVCFLDMESDREAALRLLSELAAHPSGVPAIVLLSGSDPDLILGCLRGGAGEFLVRPFTAEQLEHTLEKLSHLRRGPTPGGSVSRLYCLVPGKGACGATTVACNLAWHLQRQDSGKVLLADMDPLTGTMAFVLKLKSNYSFVDALAHAERLDADLWKVLVNGWSGLDVLLSPEDPANGTGENWSAGELVNYCRASYHTVVLDIAGAYGDWSLALARLSDEVLLVTTNELPALNAAQRAVAYLEGKGVGRGQMRLIVNRYHPERGLDTGQIEAGLQLPVFHTLPSDYEAIQKALMDGRPAPPGSRFGKGVAALAERLAGRDPPEKGGSVRSALSSLFGRR